MANQDDSTPPKCFSSLLRCLLCTGSLPTHPSDHLPHPNETTHHQLKTFQTESKLVQPPSTTTPGIVARLMGLDSFPETRTTTTRTTLDSILRSKSVNYTNNYYPHFELSKQDQDYNYHHRRAKTSVSFREVNGDFLVVCIDEIDEIGKTEAGFKTEKENRVASVKRREKGEKKKSEEMNINRVSRKVGCSVLGDEEGSLKGKMTIKGINQKGFSAELKGRKRKENCIKTTKKSSLGSACVHREFPLQVEACISEKPRTTDLKARKNVPKPASKIRKYEEPCPIINNKSKYNGEEQKAINPKAKKPLKTRETEKYVDMLLEICRLTDEDTNVKESIWIAREEFDFEDFEEICFGFGQEILDMLLYQLVIELCGFSRD